MPRISPSSTSTTWPTPSVSMACAAASTGSLAFNRRTWGVITSRTRTSVISAPRHGVARRSARAEPSLLVRALLRFVHLRLGPCLFGLGFLGGDVALRVGLVLLGLAFTAHLVVAGHGTDGFLGLALDAFDDALEAGLGAAVLPAVVAHR